MKASKGRIKGSNNILLYSTAKTSSRFTAYIADEIILLSLATLIAAQYGIFPVIFLISFRYLTDEHPVLPNSYYQELYTTILIFLTISVIYYLFEVKTSLTVGGFIAGNKLYEVDKPGIKLDKKNRIYFAIFNSLIKSFILSELINSVFSCNWSV